VINNTTVNRYSFNGPGGINRRPNAAEESASREQHVAPTAEQRSHQEFASKNKAQFANVNHGRPAAAAMDKVGGHPYTAHGKAANLSRANAVAAKTPARAAATKTRTSTAATRTRSTAAAGKTRTAARTTPTVARPAHTAARPAPTRPQPRQRAQPQRAAARPAEKAAPREKKE